MSKRVLCKFFAHGACLKGENCEFSHDWKDPANNVCTFYQKGACAYGSRCRYEHVKVARPQSSGPSSSTNHYPYHIAEPVNAASAPGVASANAVPGVELSASSRPYVPPRNPVWSEVSGHNDLIDGMHVGEPNSNNLADVVMCSFAAAGNCPRGENCPHVHGDICPTCKKQCLHPFRPDEREEHMKTCEKKHKHLEALKHSQEIECSVCLERVLSKPTAAERKFGLLSECDHPFCISCIRNWRSSSPTSGMDVNSALRACPICRKLSYFVIPSVIWYTTKEEKDEIVDSYKARLRSIDCKHFDFGNGTCPFGTSCFYKHFIKPGSVLWNTSLGLNSGSMHDYCTDSGYSSDDLDDLIGRESSDDGLEGESTGDELADAIIAAEAMAFLRMNSEFQMGEDEEPENHSDDGSDDGSNDDDSSDDGSSGEALAQAYLAAEMRAFLQMF